MGIVIKFSPSFFEYTDNRQTIEVSGGTIRESIENLIARFPIFRELLFNQENSLSVLIIYQGEVIVQNQLDRKVGDHQEILILPMVYGG